ncbi:TPA: hypothetical protein N0F65_001634 [Lagenidium giganteum]|uniref:HTH myb-type domain-containing protein n=1 Tax=Lagenidium giganteum TaxID=4803 RepID=A0AAV2YJL1_9STRA|nr:TPA: hypothetical protein N0F65_001634 [Lagenidium giganteum]
MAHGSNADLRIIARNHPPTSGPSAVESDLNDELFAPLPATVCNRACRRRCAMASPSLSLANLPRPAQGQMAITKRVQQELTQIIAGPTGATQVNNETSPPSTPTSQRRHEATAQSNYNKGRPWTTDEHDRFMKALELYPSGPWRRVADYVGSKNERQTISHAQKCRQKLNRRLTPKSKRPTAGQAQDSKMKATPRPQSQAAPVLSSSQTTLVNTASEGEDICMEVRELADWPREAYLPGAFSLIDLVEESPSWVEALDTELSAFLFEDLWASLQSDEFTFDGIDLVNCEPEELHTRSELFFVYPVVQSPTGVDSYSASWSIDPTIVADICALDVNALLEAELPSIRIG